ncbi:restriction endonuclease [Actinocrinis puniceicyclus]|uniref:Restriction endonuclease n=1 Tax=Actinocrinis puniceicyclus TaxID=977794 RepID=A0A8J7WLW9_9ACTN|nr:restriction endonuclease [Actinocrinis puniceicyclus]MBS2964771.1 restriction endonuclease [Actinocrinis puniceicyclus]
MTGAAADVEQKVTAYAETFLWSYAATVATNFGAVARELESFGKRSRLFPLYGRRIGQDTSLVLLSSDFDFYLFFIDEPSGKFKLWQQVDASDGFDQDWTLSTPGDMRARKVRELLGLAEENVLGLVNVPGTNFVADTAQTMLRDAPLHGSGRANHDGRIAQEQLPALRATFEGTQVRAGYRDAYRSLLAWTESPQTRGIAFEKLWRDVLGHHGWHPKKITIAGEDDDFTAIRNGVHILGEVRWYAKPMTGGKAREFLAKLDPRPATIGLFVSHSGFDDGARAVFRRAVNSKTVVLFGKPEIDEILLAEADPGGLFDERLREVYDYLFEAPPL